MTVAVPLPDLTVPAVDQDLGLLIGGDLSRLIDRLGLRRVDARDPAIALATNRPTALVGHNVLVLSHWIFSCKKIATEQLAIIPLGARPSQSESIR
jgi:hypothetical protein